MSLDAAAHVTLNGSELTLQDFVRVARDPTVEVRCAPDALKRVKRCRDQIEQIAREYVAAWEASKKDAGGDPALPLVYGVTTGFGEFKNIAISSGQLKTLQKNILLSHATGVGDNTNELDLANYFPAEVVRGALVLRLNTFLKGNSGVRLLVLAYIKAMLHGGIVPLVPLRGSVGSSGDLCPLAHLFSVLLGEGRYYVVKSRADMDSSTPAIRSAGTDLLHDLRETAAGELDEEDGEPFYTPSYKEGLALVNGATFATAGLALAVADAEVTAGVADIAAALNYEALCGRTRGLDEIVHLARGQRGQIDSAANLRSLLAGSDCVERSRDVQDAYSLRCAPQVHGASRDTIAYARMVVEQEINAATDNPLFFPGRKPWDLQFPGGKPEPAPEGGCATVRDEQAFSAGNFHGQPIGLAADFLAIAVAEIANISERRTQMLLDGSKNRNLPCNLIPNRGVNSGYMVAQYCAASLVSENKVLTHPASVDSIPTSANSEDHVAMATIAARKLGTVLSNTQAALAIELLCAAQAIEWRVGMGISPNPDPYRDREGAATTLPTEQKAQEEADRFKAQTAPKRRREIAASLGQGTGAAYIAIRKVAEPITEDCTLDGRIRAVWRIIQDGTLLAAVQSGIGSALRPILPLHHAE
ncbi:MAG: aromatic amino acid lyase [Planctomycetes bacterium]|nr:aromatic amino acid lyase [Planctomycetota bacterium]